MQPIIAQTFRYRECISNKEWSLLNTLIYSGFCTYLLICNWDPLSPSILSKITISNHCIETKDLKQYVRINVIYQKLLKLMR